MVRNFDPRSVHCRAPLPPGRCFHSLNMPDTSRRSEIVTSYACVKSSDVVSVPSAAQCVQCVQDCCCSGGGWQVVRVLFLAVYVSELRRTELMVPGGAGLCRGRPLASFSSRCKSTLQPDISQRLAQGIWLFVELLNAA